MMLIIKKLRIYLIILIEVSQVLNFLGYEVAKRVGYEVIR